MHRSLLLTNDYPPVISGIGTVFYHVWKHFDPGRALILTPDVDGGREFDRGAAITPHRFRSPSHGGAAKLIRMALTAWHTGMLVLFRGVREIHAGQILATGPVGYLFQRLAGIPCILWVYGGETTDVYRRSRMEARLVKTLLTRSAKLVTNSPAVTREFIDYGIPADRIIEIVPAVDTTVFTPGPRPEELARRLGIESKRVLLTVARLTPRKGHDRVLDALARLRDRDDLHYIVVGTGDDRDRLTAHAGELGLTDRVTFAGRVEDGDLPEYYRLADVYVMPNREVRGSTDSVEGFGISFIEANACGKPSIAGRSGGTAAAVVDGVTGYRVDPDDPDELAARIAHLLDHPGEARRMGEAGRARVERDFSWRDRARTLAAECPGLSLGNER